MREVPGYVTSIAVVLLIFCIALFTLGYVSLSGKIDRQAPTGVQVVPYPLMDAGGYDTPQTGNVGGEIFIVDSAQSFSKSEWRISIDNWTVFKQYTVPVLALDRTAANHDKVKWNVLDASFIVIDEGILGPLAWNDTGEYVGAQAVLIYTLDDVEYIAWSTGCYRAACYGGARKWRFGGL